MYKRQPLSLCEDGKKTYHVDIFVDKSSVELFVDGGRVNKIAAAGYLAKCYLTIAWGDGYEATNGVDHINEEYMQKVDVYKRQV